MTSHLPECSSSGCTCEPDAYGHLPDCDLESCICATLEAYRDRLDTERAAMAASYDTREHHPECVGFQPFTPLLKPLCVCTVVEAAENRILSSKGAASIAWERGVAAGRVKELAPDGWFPFGSFEGYDFDLEFDGESGDGFPLWERPVPPHGNMTLAAAYTRGREFGYSAGDQNGVERGLTMAVDTIRREREQHPEAEWDECVVHLQSALDDVMTSVKALGDMVLDEVEPPATLALTKPDFVMMMRGLAIAIQVSRTLENDAAADIALETYSRMFQCGTQAGWVFLSGEIADAQ